MEAGYVDFFDFDEEGGVEIFCEGEGAGVEFFSVDEYCAFERGGAGVEGEVGGHYFLDSSSVRYKIILSG